MDVEDKQVVKEINELIEKENKEAKGKMEEAYELIKEEIQESEGNSIHAMTTDEYILLESIEAM